jgi:threo-3-hydroxy-L-aspartate ammonia-lyase
MTSVGVKGQRMPEPSLNACFSAVQEAAAELKGHANQTPVMTSNTLDDLLSARVFFKCENFQKVGAFKFRGAYNAIRNLTDARRARGVITYSSGNHAQAIALVSRMFGVSATVVMPTNAPETKQTATRNYGAKVVLYDPAQASRDEIAKRIQEQRELTMIPPYDHPDIVAGQGTAALELFEDLESLDYLLVPCGGGGLLSGSAITAKSVCPSCRVVGVEPELADDATRSFRTGRLHHVHNPPTIADGTRTPALGDVTFPLVRAFVDDMVTVRERNIIEAVRFLYYRMKIVVEPSGALGLAALLQRPDHFRGRIGVILSGGNIDGPTMTSILSESGEPATGAR